MNSVKFSKLVKLTAVAAACFMLSACTSSKRLPPEVDASGAGTGGSHAVFPHFLDKSEYPDYRTVVVEPPAKGTALFKNDVKIYKETRKLKGTQAWTDAAAGASLSADYLSKFYSPAYGIEISKEKTPWTYYLIQRVIGDAIDGGTRTPKKIYQRVRPYVYFGERTCSTQEDDDKHVNSGSYPSGHSTYGYLLALILSEINPANQDEIYKLGIKYGYNRVVCGFHWQSDVEMGRRIAAYVNARLHADKEFLTALAKAKEEFAAAKN